MSSVMAIISKAVFEKMLGKEKPKLGMLLDTDRYTSAHARLEVLKKGDALFLVTVRPPDESLWLVAILESPKFQKEAWVAAKNTVVMTDLSAVKGKLKFDTGTGIQAKAGALGMSLQTPRILTDKDIELLRTAAGGKKPAEEEKPAAKGKKAEAKKTAKIPERGPASLQEGLQARHWVRHSPGRASAYLSAIEEQSKGQLRLWRTHGFGGASVPVFIHEPSQVLFHLLPGGSCTIGLTDEELASLKKMLEGRTDATAAKAFLAADECRPARTVDRVPAFLMAATPLSTTQIAALTTGEKSAAIYKSLRGKNAKTYTEWLASQQTAQLSNTRIRVLDAALEASGLRLPSEVEWEYAARAGRNGLFTTGATIPESTKALQHPWGLVALGTAPELCADGWTPNHAGAPNDASARTPGKFHVVRGGAEGSSAGSVPWRWMLSSARRSHASVSEIAIRPVFSLS